MGTGRNLAHYHRDVRLTAIDLSHAMLRKAKRRAADVSCQVEFRHADAMVMGGVPSHSYDWVISIFMCCVMPDELQPLIGSRPCQRCAQSDQHLLPKTRYLSSDRRAAQSMKGVLGDACVPPKTRAAKALGIATTPLPVPFLHGPRPDVDELLNVL